MFTKNLGTNYEVIHGRLAMVHLDVFACMALADGKQDRIKNLIPSAATFLCTRPTEVLDFDLTLW